MADSEAEQDDDLNVGARRQSWRSIAARWALGVGLAASTFTIAAFVEARADPVIRILTLRTVDGPTRPFRILLMSDIHSQPSDMSPGRLSRIVRLANRLRPDLVVIAGDFLGNDGFGRAYSINEGLRPLGMLRSRYGSFAVLGNHDRTRRAIVSSGLRALGIRLLDDEAVRVGPISLAGLDGRFRRTTKELLKLPGPRIFVAHSPQQFTRLPRGIALMLSGHTHCGQISLPGWGPVLTGGDIPRGYACGVAHRDGKALVVTAGLGTSKVPLRFAAPPDMWLISVARAS